MAKQYTPEIEAYIAYLQESYGMTRSRAIYELSGGNALMGAMAIKAINRRHRRRLARTRHDAWGRVAGLVTEADALWSAGGWLARQLLRRPLGAE